jgi:hypothetical protein
VISITVTCPIMTIIRNYIILYKGPPICPNPFRASSAQVHPAPHLLKSISRPFPLKSTLLPFILKSPRPFLLKSSNSSAQTRFSAYPTRGYPAAAPPRRCSRNPVSPLVGNNTCEFLWPSSSYHSLSFSGQHSPYSVHLSTSL